MVTYMTCRVVKSLLSVPRFEQLGEPCQILSTSLDCKPPIFTSGHELYHRLTTRPQIDLGFANRTFSTQVSVDSFHAQRVATLRLERLRAPKSYYPTGLWINSLSQHFADEECRRKVNEYLDKNYPPHFVDIFNAWRRDAGGAWGYSSDFPIISRIGSPCFFFDPVLGVYPARGDILSAVDYWPSYVVDEALQPADHLPGVHNHPLRTKSPQASSLKGGPTAHRKPTALPLRN